MENTPITNPSPETKLTNEQIERIADENGEIYRRDIFKTSWKIRSQGLWAGGAIGLFFGAIIGALTLASTLIVGVSLASIGAMFLPVVAAFAISGMVAGVAAVSLVGANVGAAVGAEKVKDRKRLLNSPEQALAETIEYKGTAEEKETFWNKILPFTKGSREIFSIRNGLIFGALGVGVGLLLISVAPALGGGALMIGTISAFVKAHVAASLFIPAINCMTIAACGLFGAFFGVDIPTIGANASKFFGDIFTGRLFKSSPELAPQVANEISAKQQRATTVTPEEAALLNSKLPKPGEKNYQNMLNVQNSTTVTPSMSSPN